MINSLKHWIIYLWTLVAFNAIHAQQPVIDSLASLLTTMEKTTPDKVRLLDGLSRAYIVQADYDCAAEYAQLAIDLGKSIDFHQGVGYAYSRLGAIDQSQSNLPKAIVYYNQALYYMKMEDVKDVDGLIQNIHNSLGSCYADLGNYPEAVNNYYTSLHLSELAHDTMSIIGVSINLGIIQAEHEHLEESQQTLKKVIPTLLKNGDRYGLAIVYENIGQNNLLLNDTATAMQNLMEAMKYFEAENDQVGLKHIYYHIGTVYSRQKKYEEAIKYFNKSIALGKESDDNRAIALAEGGIGIVYMRKNQPVEAKKWFTSALNRLHGTDLISDIMETHSAMAQADSALGNFEGAFIHFKISSSLRDSLFNEDNTRKSVQSEMKYAFTKTTDSLNMVNAQEIALRDQRIAANRKQRWFMAGGMLLLAIIGSLLFFQNRQRKSHNAALAELNSELDHANKVKTRFFSILNHDLRAPISNVIKMTRLVQNQPDLMTPGTRLKLENQTIHSAENLLNSMEELLLWSKGQMENFQPEIKVIHVNDLFSYIADYFQIMVPFSIHFENPNQLTLNTDGDYLKTIMRNLTNNAIKALVHQANPKITWKAWQENGNSFLSIADNGPGIKAEDYRALYDDTQVVGIKTGLGLHLIRDLAKAIHGELTVNSQEGEGTEIVIRFSEKQ